MLTRRKTVWLLAPFSTTLPGVAESDRIGYRVSTLKFQAITKQEAQTGHSDSDATPMLRLHSLISADAFMLTKSRYAIQSRHVAQKTRIYVLAVVITVKCLMP